MDLKEKLLCRVRESVLSEGEVLGLLLDRIDNSVLEEFISYLDDFDTIVQQPNSSGVFMTQEEEDDYNASNPSSRSYCLECGDDYEWFMHNCQSSVMYEDYGCKKCDDHCSSCEVC